VQVNFALPQAALEQFGVQGHIFADTGSITRLSGKESAASRLDSFWNQWRLAVGFGIKIPFGIAGHMEANFVQTLSRFGQDVTKQGLQFGFSSDPYVRVPPRDM
jgi:outer membrane protein insertion porin family